MPRFTITPIDGLTLARRDGEIVAASLSALRLEEEGYPPVTYFPAAGADPSLLTPAEGRTTCPHKGEAAWFELAGSGKVVWTYYDPATEAAAPIAGHLAFTDEAVTVETAELPQRPAVADAVLDFWFDEVPPEKRFVVDAALDEKIWEKFGPLHQEAAAGELDGWTGHPESALALLILLDQFSRNLFREDGRAFAQDPKALRIAEDMVVAGHDLALPPEKRAFVYLPFMHTENLEVQNLSVALYERRLPGAVNVSYALGHREEIHRYGRFRGRDEALGRG